MIDKIIDKYLYKPNNLQTIESITNEIKNFLDIEISNNKREPYSDVKISMDNDFMKVVILPYTSPINNYITDDIIIKYIYIGEKTDSIENGELFIITFWYDRIVNVESLNNKNKDIFLSEMENLITNGKLVKLTDYRNNLIKDILDDE